MTTNFYKLLRIRLSVLVLKATVYKYKPVEHSFHMTRQISGQQFSHSKLDECCSHYFHMMALVMSRPAATPLPADNIVDAFGFGQ